MFSFRYPAVVLLACAVTGTLLGRELDPGLPIISLIIIAAGCFLLYGWLRLRREYFIIPLALLTISVTFLGANKMFQSFPADDIGRFVDGRERLQVFGEIAKWPLIRRHKTTLICQLDSIAAGKTVVSASGAILVNISRETTRFSLGDQICFHGKLRQSVSGGYPGQFDYARYLSSKGIRGMVYISDPGSIFVRERQHNYFGKGINKVRQWILECFNKNLTEIPSALASGFLIGETHDIPDDVYRAFRRTGTLHLLAVSGSNVALVLVVIHYLLYFFRLKRITRLFVMLAVIVVFAHLSYNQPSVIRASIMAALVLIARVFYRRIDLHNIIAAAAAILIFYDPGNLYDIGFQLSFAVTWALILFLPHINRSIVDRQLPPSIRYLLLIIFSSLIATLVSAPITAYYFGELSMVTVCSNLLIVPLVSAAVIGIAILLLVSLIFPAAAILPGMFLDRILGLIHSLVLWFGQWKFAAISTTSFPAWYVYIFLAGVTLGMLAISYQLMRRLLAIYAVILGGYFVSVGIWGAPEKKPDLEIFNLGITQTTIINQGVGTVVFHHFGDSRYDPFSADLLPYLARRDAPFPRYFVFLESPVKTENRLHLSMDKGLNISFWPLSIDSGNHSLSIWTTSRPEPNSKRISDYVFHPMAGTVIVQLPDSSEVLFVREITDLKIFSIQDIQEIGYYFVPVSDKIDLRRINARYDRHKAVLLLRRPVEAYTDLDDLIDRKHGFPTIVGAEDKTVYLQLNYEVGKKPY